MESIDKYSLLQLKAGYDMLMSQVKGLRVENEQLKKEVVELKDRLGINSSNSSLPPSSDFKKQKKERKPTGKKRGGQVGRKGNSRPLIDISEVNKVECVLPQSTCECGGNVSVDYSKPWRHQKVDLPKIMPDITEYQMHAGCCDACGAKYRAELPNGVGYHMLGPRAMSFLAQLSSTYNVTRKKIQKLFQEWFGIKISLGCISESEGRISEYLQECYNVLEAELKKQMYLNADETSHKESGRRHYGWIFTNEDMTFLSIKPSRGKKVLKNLFPNGYNGEIISDRYAAYNVFDIENRQVCFAHLLRDFTRFSNSADPYTAKIGKGLVHQTEVMFSLYHRRRKGEISEEKFLAGIEEIKKRIDCLLYRGREVFGLPRLNRFCKNIEKIRPALWNFAYSNGKIEPTNNLAERDLRQFVIWRKISFGSQSERGSRFMERMISVKSTCAKQGVDFSEFLIDATQSFLCGTPKSLTLNP
jgi:transposase